MQLGSRWLVATRFGAVLVRRRLPAEGAFEQSPEAWTRRQRIRFELLWELGSSALVTDAFRGLAWLLRGLSTDTRLDATPTAAEIRELERVFDAELMHGRIELEFIERPRSLEERRERETAPPALPPLPPPPPDQTFIAVRLIDTDGEPVIGRKWVIDLPDGAHHAGLTDTDGWARVSGFKQDGMAQVRFPEFDEQDHQTQVSSTREVIPLNGDAGAADSDATDTERSLEVTILKANGDPLPGAVLSVTCDDGTELQATTGDDGLAKIAGLTSDNAVVKLVDRQASA